GCGVVHKGGRGGNLGSLKLPLKKGWLRARERGARGGEIDARHELRPEALSHTGVRQVRKMLDDLNLRAAALTFRTRRGYYVLDDLEARLEATRRGPSWATRWEKKWSSTGSGVGAERAATQPARH